VSRPASQSSIAPPIQDNAVLRKSELGVALGISEDVIEDLVRRKALPVIYLTERTPRFIYGDVLAALRALATPVARESKPEGGAP
jgi:hypothetical protein